MLTGTMEMHRVFALQKFQRDIESVSDVQVLQQMSVELMQLYLHQQDTVQQLVKKGWLPDGDF
tara:strand:- start:773 stop:961 length:189 start_codon:yes stop_codon:yes gene_type:complete